MPGESFKRMLLQSAVLLSYEFCNTANMILALVDDLMFTSKIRTAATQLGVAVKYARSSMAALDEMRKERPALVILDLNNPRTDPLGTVSTMHADAELATIPTI